MDIAVIPMKIDIIDDFLTDYYANIFVKTFGDSKFPWFFVDDLNHVQRRGNYYFNHSVIREYEVKSQHWLPIFEPLVNRIGVSFRNVYKLKVNLYTRTQFRVHHFSHTDYDPNLGLRTCLYYVNTNNGFTVFDGKRKIRSKKNRAIIFDGSTKHHSTTPTDSNWRCSINMDYKL